MSTPNMMLTLPTVGVTSGPDYATEVNSAFTVIDNHNHSAGSGVQITPAGLNINTTLSIQNNSLISIKSLILTSQASTLSSPISIYAAPNGGTGKYDLWFNDGTGTQIALTKSGGVNGAPGNITGLPAPNGIANITFTNIAKTFSFGADTANVSASVDCASVLIRKTNTALSPAVTLAAPNSLSSNETLTLPILPGSAPTGGAYFFTTDQNGTMSASIQPDASTIVIASNILKVPTSGITPTQLATNAVTTAKIADANVTPSKLAAFASYGAISNSCGSFNQTSVGVVAIPNLTATIPTVGRPIHVSLIPDYAGGNAEVKADVDDSYVFFTLDGSPALNFLRIGAAPPSGYSMIIPASAGSHTIVANVVVNNSGNTQVINCRLIAYEL